MVLSNHAARGKPKGNIDVRAGPDGPGEGGEVIGEH